jgi:hypothetical protein
MPCANWPGGKLGTAGLGLAGGKPGCAGFIMGAP